MAVARRYVMVAFVTSGGLVAASAACTAITGLGSLEEVPCAADCGATSPETGSDGKGGSSEDAASHRHDAAPKDGPPSADGNSDAADTSPASDGVAESGPSTPITFVQTNSGSAGVSASLGVSFGSDVSAGHFLVVGLDYDSASGASLSSVEDSVGNGFAVATGPFDGAGIRQYILYAVNVASGPDMVTVTLDAATTSFLELRLHEYAGIAAMKPFDIATSSTGTSTAPDGMVTSPITTAGDNELIFAMGICGSCTSGTGFTLRSNFDDDVTEDEIAVKAGSYRGIATMTSGSGWALSVAAFRGL